MQMQRDFWYTCRQVDVNRFLHSSCAYSRCITSGLGMFVA